jgi:tetratricopeptide (TPR) repeat protein
MKRGQDYFDKMDYPHAVIEFRNALQILPKDVGAQLMAARAAEKLGRVREALVLYQGILDRVPENLEARKDLSRLMVYGGAFDAGLKVIEPGLAQHPDDPDLLALRATVRSRMKNVEGALEDADHALRVAPDNLEALQVRAGLYKQKGDLPGAIALVSAAVKKLPSELVLHDMLVDLYTVTGKPDLAESELRALVSTAPKDPQQRYRLAIFYSRAHKLDDAQRVLEDTIQAFPTNNEPKMALVDFLASQRTREDAEKRLREFIAKDPDNDGLRLGLGSLLQRAGALKEATEAYEEVANRKDGGPNALVALNREAVIAVAQGKVDEARKLIEKVLQKNPRDNDALLQRAGLAIARSDPARAITDLRAVLRDQPQSVRVRQLLAKAYEQNGESGLAEEALRTAMQLAPTDNSLPVELARLLLRTHRPEPAVTLLEEAAQRVPSDLVVQEDLARAYLIKKDFPAAQRTAQALEKAKPGLPAAAFVAGMAEVGLNHPDEAQKDLEEALKRRPGAFETLQALERLDLARGRLPQAITLISDAVKNAPSDPLLLNMLGDLYLQQKNPTQAVEVENRAISSSPQWGAPYRNLALAKLMMKDTPGAIAAYEAALKAAPTDAEPLTELALLYERVGRVDDAIALFNGWCQRDPKAAAPARYLALLLVTYKNDRQSLDRARDLTSGFASSGDGTLLDVNGWVRFKRAEYTDALAVLQRAAERAPGSREIRYHLGMAELRLGHIDEAKTDLETAVAGSASFVGADEARSTLASLKKGQAG